MIHCRDSWVGALHKEQSGTRPIGELAVERSANIVHADVGSLSSWLALWPQRVIRQRSTRRSRRNDATSAHSEVSSDEPKVERRNASGATIAISFKAVAETHHRRAGGSDHGGKHLDVGLVDATFGAGAFESPLIGRSNEVLCANGIGRQELSGDEPTFVQQSSSCICKYYVGTGSNSQMQIGASGNSGSTRIDHDQLRSAFGRRSEQRQQVSVRGHRVRPPHNDEFGVFEIERIGAEHRAKYLIPRSAHG